MTGPLLLPGFMPRKSENFAGILSTAQLNPVPVFGAQKNTSTIWQKFSTEIFVQMVSARDITFFPVFTEVSEIFRTICLDY